MGVFSSIIVFSIEGWDLGGRGKQIFIFLTINLLFLVLFHFYNYTLDWHLCKIILQIEQEVRTNGSALVEVGLLRR
jgi:hypothetical protein